MTTQKYGPQTAEIEALVERIKTITLEQVRNLTEAHSPSWSREAHDARDTALSKQWATKRESAWSMKWESALSTAWMTVWDAILALTVRDLITTEQFDILYAPWKSVMEDSQLHALSYRDDNQSQSAEIERLNSKIKELQQQLDESLAETSSVKAWLGMTDDQLLRRAEKAEADLARFHSCDDSNGCYDDCGRVHIYDTEDPSFSYARNGERPRTVWHKDGE